MGKEKTFYLETGTSVKHAVESQLLAGALVLILPFFPAKLKEWAYAGFGITMISAFVSYCVVDGFSFAALCPLFFIGILSLS